MQKAVNSLLALSLAALIGGANAADKDSSKTAPTPEQKQGKKEVVKKKINKSSDDKQAVKKPDEKK